MIMASRRRDGPLSRSAESTGGLKTAHIPRIGEKEESNVDTEESLRELPPWLRLYFYGMHGVSLDVLLSSMHGVLAHRDPKLVGFSSPYLCIMHSLTHYALEKVYSRKNCFRGRPVVFHLVFYPSVYIGLQILIGNISTLTEQVRMVSCSQLAVHYVLSLYFSHVFHRGVSKLQWRNCSIRGPEDGARHHWGGLPSDALPGFVRFLFFGMQGFVDEILFTAAFNLVEKSDRALGGHTSIWSFLMYGSCSYVVEKLYFRLKFGRGWGTLRRLPIYVCFIYAWEFCWGLALRQFDACSWDYSHYPHNFMGLITLLYLPGWVCLSLYQDVLSNVLMRIKCGKDGGPRDGSGENGEAGGGVNGEMNGQLEPKKKCL